MKLEDRTRDEKYPTFKIGKMNDEGKGVPFGENITIKLLDKFNPLSITRMEKHGTSWVRKDITFSENKSDFAVVKGTSFVTAKITGTLVGTVVDNIKYNDYQNASFEISVNNALKLAKLGEDKLKGLTVEFELTSFDKEEDGTTKKIKYFKMSEILDDGSSQEIGSSNASSSSSKLQLDLTDVEKSVFKKARTDAAWTEWAEYGKQSVENFKLMYNSVAENISVKMIDEDRVNILYVQFCNA